VLEHSAAYATVKTRVSQLKADQVLTRIAAEVKGVAESHALDHDTAFPRRTAGSQRRWRAAILLRQGKMIHVHDVHPLTA
jgi:hypothetical protein